MAIWVGKVTPVVSEVSMFPETPPLAAAVEAPVGGVVSWPLPLAPPSIADVGVEPVQAKRKKKPTK